ncbi:MAG: TolC family protein [Deltaproteobacteria bacterium]|nr:MAG: TolC family protein [Deltaproteobacteria bacterium]
MFRAPIAIVLCAAAVRAEPQPASESAPQLPPVLTLQKALEIFRQRGFDLLVAEASILSAEGDVTIAGALPNPGLSFSAGKNFQCSSSQDCSVISYSVGVSDNDLVSNFLTGKRGLRKDLARAALQAARRSRDDAQRTLEFTLKQSWYQALAAAAQREVARENRDSFLRTRQLDEKRFELGAMNEADLATIQVAHLEAEQALETAEQSLRAAKVAVAFLLGFRRLIPDFAVDQKDLDFALPGPVAAATREALLKDALERRPDLAALTQQVERADSALRLARRNVFPDIGLGITYSANGSGDSNISPPNGSINIFFAPPLLYFQSGEIRKAEADLVTQQILRQKAEAVVVSDVETAWGQLQATRKLVERMQASLLERAERARNLVQVQYEKGAASLLDLLNAQRTYTATRGEYAQDLASYWIAVSLLEQATARGLKS